MSFNVDSLTSHIVKDYILIIWLGFSKNIVNLIESNDTKFGCRHDVNGKWSVFPAIISTFKLRVVLFISYNIMVWLTTNCFTKSTMNLSLKNKFLLLSIVIGNFTMIYIKRLLCLSKCQHILRKILDMWFDVMCGWSYVYRKY